SLVWRRWVGRVFHVLAARCENDLPPVVVLQTRGTVARGEVGGAEMPGVEGESSVEVFWSGVVQCFVSVGEEF
ncbi:hypothetical protein NDU88_003627, partial [Pleurodeles waltl]